MCLHLKIFSNPTGNNFKVLSVLYNLHALYRIEVLSISILQKVPKAN